MEGIIQDYFVNPIFERTGYNAINTLTYAAIALVSIYLIWRFFRLKKFDFAGKGFLYGTAAFVLFGSTCRVVTDLSDAGAIGLAAKGGGVLGQAYSAVDSSGLFSYGYLTVTPGIYLVTAALFLLSIAIGRAMKKPMLPFYAGIFLWLPCFVLLLPFMAHFQFLAIGIALSVIGSLLACAALEKFGKMKLSVYQRLAIFGQALDGAATYVVIDIFGKQAGRGYFEQHVLSAGIGEATPLGFFLFFLVKTSLASTIVYFISKEEMDVKDKALVLIVVGIMGFAPGIRDLLRMLCGT